MIDMDKINNSLKKNLFYNTCYQILSLIVPLITAPYISRVLGTEGMGEYSYTFSIAHYFVLLMMLGVLNYGNREIARVKDNHCKLKIKFWGIYSVQFVLGIIVSLLYIFFVLVLCNNYRIVAMTQMLYIISGIIDISWFYFGIEKFKTTAGISTLNKIITTILIFVFVRSASDVYVYTIIIAGGVLLNNIIYWALLKRYVEIGRIELREIKKHIKPLLILFVPVIAVSVYKYMDKIMIGAMIDIAEVGIYEAAEKYINLPLSIITAVGTVMLPRISNLKKNSDVNTVKRYNYCSMILIMCIGFGITFGLAGISKCFIPWFYGKNFSKSAIVLLILLPSVVFVSWANVIRTQCLLPNKRDKEYCISVILGAIVNFAVNFAFIPKYGAIGAAIGTTIAELTVCLIQTYETRTDMQFDRYFYNSIPFLINGLVMYFIIIHINLEKDIITITIRILCGFIVYLLMSIFFIKRAIRAK